MKEQPKKPVLKFDTEDKLDDARLEETAILQLQEANEFNSAKYNRVQADYRFLKEVRYPLLKQFMLGPKPSIKEPIPCTFKQIVEVVYSRIKVRPMDGDVLS